MDFLISEAEEYCKISLNCSTMNHLVDKFNTAYDRVSRRGGRTAVVWGIARVCPGQLAPLWPFDAARRFYCIAYGSVRTFGGKIGITAIGDSKKILFLNRAMIVNLEKVATISTWRIQEVEFVNFILNIFAHDVPGTWWVSSARRSIFSVSISFRLVKLNYTLGCCILWRLWGLMHQVALDCKFNQVSLCSQDHLNVIREAASSVRILENSLQHAFKMGIKSKVEALIILQAGEQIMS